MTLTASLDFTSMVKDGDLELASLSDEQFEALWAAERLEIDPESEPMIMAAVRALVAAGLAEPAAEGGLRLLGDAALIRAVRTRPSPSIVWQHTEADDTSLDTWTMVSDDVLLEQKWEVPGVHRFSLRQLRRAVIERVERLVPAASVPLLSQADSGVQADTELLGKVRRELHHLTRADVFLPADANGTEENLNLSFTLASDGVSRCVLLEPATDGTAIVDATRAELRRHLVNLLSRSSQAGPSTGPPDSSSGPESGTGDA